MSDEFPLPSYQDERRRSPRRRFDQQRSDAACPTSPPTPIPDTGYSVRVDGEDTVVGGTSAVAPLWAGLIARINQGLGKPIGFINPTLYGLTSQSGVFRDVTSGNNGAYSAGPGWDACSGLGVADGAKLLKALSP